MQIKHNAILLIFIFFLNGCVTSNSLNFEEPKTVEYQDLCLRLEYKEAKRGLFVDENKSQDLSEVRIDKINRTLKNLKINSTCDRSDAKKFIVMINNKTSSAKLIAAGVNSIFTIFSLAIIPTYLSNDMEIVLLDGDRQILKRDFSSTTWVWLPFAIKQWNDDTKALELYQVEARSAVIGLEIGKLLVDYAEEKDVKP